MSCFIPSILSPMLTPRCFPLLTQGKSFPQSLNLGNSLFFLRKAIHFVLHFLGSGSVLNEIMAICISFTDCKHLLESMEAWGQQEVIIRISQNTKEIPIYPTTILAAPEDLEEVIHIDTIKYSTENCSLANTILHCKEVGEITIPSDICKLISINEYKQSDKNQR